MSSIDNLANEISKSLEKYSKVTNDEIEKASNEAANNAVKSLKTSGAYEDKRGKYRKSFGVAKDKKGYKKSSIVYNKEFGLTHLLEFGHMTRDGTSRTKAFPHWEKAEEQAIKDFEERLTKGIESL